RLSPPLPRRRGMSRRERRAPHEASLAIEYRDLDLYRSAGDGGLSRRLRRARDRIAKWDASLLGMGEGLGRRVRSEDARGKRSGAASALGKGGEDVKIDLAAARMKIEQALCELRHLADAACDGDARNGVAAHIFQH